MFTFPGFAFYFGPFFFLRLTAAINGGHNKSPLFDGQVQKLGGLPAKLLQTKVCIVCLRVTLLN